VVKPRQPTRQLSLLVNPAEHPQRPLLIFLGVTGFDGKGVDEAEDYKPITGKAKIVSLGHSAMRAAA
jgi:hypothetical protein